MKKSLLGLATILTSVSTFSQTLWQFDMGYAPIDLSKSAATENSVDPDVKFGMEFGAQFGLPNISARSAIGFGIPQDQLAKEIDLQGLDHSVDYSAGFLWWSNELVASYSPVYWLNGNVAAGWSFAGGERSLSLPEDVVCYDCPKPESLNIDGGGYIKPSIDLFMQTWKIDGEPDSKIGVRLSYQKFLTDSDLQDNLQLAIVLSGL